MNSLKIGRKKVIAAVTVSGSAILIRGMPAYLRERGYTVILASTPGPEMDELVEGEKAEYIPIVMAREPKPFRDLLSLLQVVRCIRKIQPDLVNAGTPKAGFLFILASWILRVPHRIYLVRGLRHESLTGYSEKLQVFIERLTGMMATGVICLTESVRQLALEQRLYHPNKCVVLGPGSSGIELDRFDPVLFSPDERLRLRYALGIAPEAFVLGYVGRLVPRKGISELMTAWQELRDRYPNAVLLLVGPKEDAQTLSLETLRAVEADPRVISVGKVVDVSRYYSVMDVFTLPAHWEGFGNVVVEAAAMGVPVVTTSGTGTRDAAADGYNAQLVPVKDASALTAAIARYFDSPDLRAEHGKNGIEWSKRFSRHKINGHLYEFYQGLLEPKNAISMTNGGEVGHQ